MKMYRTHMLRAAVSAFAIAALPISAWAQDSAAEEDNGGIDEILVTAQRSSQKLMDVPLSISATSGEQLDRAGIRQMSDLQMTTPGFLPSNASGYNQMFIRGVGNAIFVGADPSVATFIDDVPRVFGTLVNNFVDVERVEVIKGAPGALYGRNATGGAVNIITRQPDTDEASGKGRISYGEKDTFQASAFVNLPLSENIAMTLAGERRSHDFYVDNITQSANPYTAAMFPVNNAGGPGTASFVGTPAATAAFFNSGLKSVKGVNDEDFWAVSGKLLFKAGDNFKITFAGDYSKKEDSNGNGLKNTTPDWAVLNLSGLLNAFAGASTTPAGLSSFSVPVTGKFQSALRREGHVKLKDWGFSATAVLELPGVDLTSITGLRKNRSSFYTELGSTPFSLFAAAVDISKKTFYQELRAVSTGDGPLHWIAGASYLKANFDGGLLTDILVPLVVGAPSGQGGYVVNNWSAFAQLTYDLNDQLSLMASGRYIHETNKAHQPTLTAPVNLKEQKFLPAATLTYKLDGGGNVYLRYARGFKAGGIVPVTNLAVFPNPRTQGGIFGGETIDTFEAGVKAPLAGNKVNVSAAVFYNAYKDVHVAAHANATYQAQGVTIAVVNAGTARTYGAEASITARVAEPLTVGASVAYLNAKYKDFFVPANVVIDEIALSGTRMINAPEWQLSFNADLDQPISDSLSLTGNVVAAHTSEVLWQASGLPGVLDDSTGNAFWLVNARMGIKASDDKWALSVFANNLFNAAYSTFGNSASGYGNLYNWGDPRVFGVEASFKF